MGLDSVELVMRIEDFVGYQFSNEEAENMRSIQDVVNLISEKINFRERGTDIRQRVYEELKSLFIDHIPKTSQFGYSEHIFKLVPADHVGQWKEISKQSKFTLPFESEPGLIGRIFEKIFPKTACLDKVTVDRFIQLTCALNYDKLVINDEFQNSYELTIAIMGITIDQCGIDPFEVFPESEFVRDLGIE
jgi:hypothetical protein